MHNFWFNIVYVSTFTFNALHVRVPVGCQWTRLHFLDSLLRSTLLLWHHKGYVHVSPLPLPVATFYWNWVYQKYIMSVLQFFCFGEKKQALDVDPANFLKVDMNLFFFKKLDILKVRQFQEVPHFLNHLVFFLTIRRLDQTNSAVRQTFQQRAVNSGLHL